LFPARMVNLENALIESNHLYSEDNDFPMHTRHSRIGCGVCTEPIMKDQLLEKIDLYLQRFQRYVPRR